MSGASTFQAGNRNDATPGRHVIKGDVEASIAYFTRLKPLPEPHNPDLTEDDRELIRLLAYAHLNPGPTTLSVQDIRSGCRMIAYYSNWAAEFRKACGQLSDTNPPVTDKD